ncbi:MAG: hypothetical protein JRI47_03990 [Deltaproteobacteria bacterium]|nr:hypothetical protein [Deltaproteobacteria bacterium]
MGTDKKHCDAEMLSRFSDRELGSGEHARTSRHLGHCLTCQSGLEDQRAISGLFRTGLEMELLKAGLEDVEESVISFIRGKSVPWWMSAGKVVTSLKFYVPATAAATVLLLFLFLPWPQNHVSEPSAIISYVGGDVECVMILETRESRQAIVWFNEALVSGEESGGIQNNQAVV